MASTSILFIDLETQNHPYYGGVASPYCPKNYVVEAGWRVDRTTNGKVETGQVQSIRYPNRAAFEASQDWFQVPDDCWLIVAHNAAYEVSWFLEFARESFEKFLKRGGRVFCTMHGEYLATNQQSMYPSLDETAPKYGGTHKVDGIKILWQQGVLTSDIDPVLLHHYLCHPVEGDVANTACVFYGLMNVLTEQSKFPLVWQRMDALLSFAYCEWFGMFVNMPVAKANQEQQEQEIQEIRAELQALLPPDMPDELEFNWGSDFHVSAWLYGGPIKYRCKVPYDEPKFVKKDCYLYKNGERGSFVGVDEPPLEGWTVEKYQRGKNRGQPKVYKIDTDEPLMKWGEAVYNFQGYFDINSLSKEVRDDFLEQFAQNRTLLDGTPVISSSADALKAVGSFGVPQAKVLIKLATLEKDTGTYYLRTEYNEDGSVKSQKGMLQYVIPTQEDGSGIIHHRLNTCSTVTGRLSSSNPNLQNLPRDGTSKVKQMFTSRFGAQGRIIEVDYSALEVVMGCVHTGDRKLLELLQAGTDMHCYRLAFKHKMLYEEVFKLCHDKSGADYAYWHEARTKIKPPSFAAQYGATAMGIAFATGLPLEYCQEFLDNEAKLFPDTMKFRDVVMSEVVKTSMDNSQIHREKMDSGGFQIYRTGYWTAPTGMRYQFRQYPKKSWNPVTRKRETTMEFKPTQVANYWCQGEAFYLMAVAFGVILREFLKRDWFGGKVCLVTNVHDAVYLDAADEEVGREAALLAKKCMEEARFEVLKHFPNYGILAEVPFPAAAEMGPSMYDKVEVK